MGCFILGNGNLRFNSQELLWWLPLKFYDISFSWYQEKVARKSYIFPRSISSYVYLNNNNAQQQQGTDVHAHLLKQTFGIVFFFCLEEWLRPLLRQDKQVLVHWWYYPDRWVFNC